MKPTARRARRSFWLHVNNQNGYIDVFTDKPTDCGMGCEWIHVRELPRPRKRSKGGNRV